MECLKICLRGPRARKFHWVMSLIVNSYPKGSG
jgi:hypothetical protein